MILKRNSFLYNVTVLSSSSALAQASTILASPILTRLYTPADFGLLAIFMAIVSSLSMAVCGKYEIAMVLPKSETSALHLFGIAIYFALCVSTLFGLTIFFTNESLLILLDAASLGKWVYLTAVMLFLRGLYVSLGYFSNRHKEYGVLAKSKLLSAWVVIAVNIGCGILGVDFKGLLLGNFLGVLFFVIYILCKQRTNLGRDILGLSQQKIKLLKQYREYPLINASSAILNGITLSLPVFYLSRYFPDSTVGYFALVTRVAHVPISFLSQSISQVHFKKVVELIHFEQPIQPYLHRLALILLLYISIPTIVLTIWSPELFKWVFGAQWSAAGVYMQILMPAIALRFVSSTLSITLEATQRNRLTALWRVSAFLSTLAVLSWYAPQGDIIKVLIALSAKDICIALLYYMFITQAARYPRKTI